jgi:hypothetical protein
MERFNLQKAPPKFREWSSLFQQENIMYLRGNDENNKSIKNLCISFKKEH